MLSSVNKGVNPSSPSSQASLPPYLQRSAPVFPCHISSKVSPRDFLSLASSFSLSSPSFSAHLLISQSSGAFPPASPIYFHSITPWSESGYSPGSSKMLHSLTCLATSDVVRVGLMTLWRAPSEFVGLVVRLFITVSSCASEIFQKVIVPPLTAPRVPHRAVGI